jgi:hypothetical protein
MRAEKVWLLGVVVAVGLSWLVAAGCNRAWNSPDPPGEWADAAAAGSGYGTGLARRTHVFGEPMRIQGPSPDDNTSEKVLKRRAAEEADAGADKDGGAARSR